MRVPTTLCLLLVFALGGSACLGDPAPARCVAGTQITCGCPGGSLGVQVCLSAGSFGACACAPPADATVDATPVTDVGTTDAGTTDVGATDVGTTDVGTVPGDGARADVATDSPPADLGTPPVDAGAPDDVAVVGDGIGQEQRAPWRSSACTLWEQVPPQCLYQSAADDEGGLWAVCGDHFVMRHTAAGWARVQLSAASGGGLRAVATGTGWVAAVGYAVSGFAFVRRDGAWSELALPEGLPQPAAAHGAGTDLFVAGYAGQVFRHDGAAWSDLGLASGAGRPNRLWGTRTNLYEAYERGVRRYDGARWVGLTVPAPESYLGVGGVSPSEVFAVTHRGLYRVDGTTLRAEAPPAGCASLEYLDFAAGSSGVVLLGRCNGALTVWRRTGAAWTALPTPLSNPLNARVHLAASGAVYLMDDGPMGPVRRLVDGAWRSLTETPAPQGEVLAARSASELWTGGVGVTRLGPDGRWQPVGGSEGLVVRALWQAPQGTLFAATLASGMVTLRRYDEAGWHADRTSPATLVSNFAGRSASDVYVALDNDVLRWNGSTWSSMGPGACAPGNRMQGVFVAGTRLVYAACDDAGTTAWREHGGSGWAGVLLRGVGVQAGPVATPALLLINGGLTTRVQVRTDAGWAETSLPSLASGGGWTAPDPQTLVSGAFQRSRPTGTTVISDWTTRRIVGSGTAVWSDGRIIAGSDGNRSPGGVDARTGRVVRCDFGS